MGSAKLYVEPIVTILEHREIYDRAADLDDLVRLLRDLDPAATIALLCQLNADLRLTKRDRESVARTQKEIAGGLLSDDLIARLKHGFGPSHLADRPIFHAAQVLNMIGLVAQHSSGTMDPYAVEHARHALGSACFMMSDLMMTEQERNALKARSRDDISRTLMIQMASPFELQNPEPIQHVAYRSRIMFQELLKKESILARIRQQCQQFDMEREFLRITNLPLSRWLHLIFAFYAYLMHYLAPDGAKDHKFLIVDRLNFRKDTPIPQEELDRALKTLSFTLADLRRDLMSDQRRDWRHDFVPFRSKPLVELAPGRFCCTDLGLLAEKLHSGAYWAVHDGLQTSKDRFRLSRAWTVLFEEYVNAFLGGRSFKDFAFWPAPQWSHGAESFDGALMKGSVFVPMEYKGGLLNRAARYSLDQGLFEKDLEDKIVAGCSQLARKIELLFNKQASARRRLRDIHVDHITRIVPVLVIQDRILGGPLVNWWLNKRFNSMLDRAALRADVTVDSLNVVGIRELETMVESAEAGPFDLFHGLQLRCYRDPEMTSNLHNFLLELPGYGDGKSTRIQDALDEDFREAINYLFGKTE